MSTEKLIFEMGAPGRRAALLPAMDVPTKPLDHLVPRDMLRAEPAPLPEVSEIEVVRHFTHLSQRNFGVDTGFYPLGSCTMKYNPKVNEEMAGLPGFARIHPLEHESMTQGAIQMLYELEGYLAEIAGMERVTLQPAAGAHGEITGLMIIKAYHVHRGEAHRDIVLIPDGAHGTNPASATLADYRTVELKSDARGGVDVEHLKQVLALHEGKIAALMMTNPNTLGVFEQDIHKIAQLMHAKGGLLYMDGANMNALVGKVRPGDFGVDVMHLNLHKTFSTPHGGGGPGSGPVAIKKALEPFLPRPVLISKPDATLGFDYDRPQSIGRVRSFYGNFGMFVRALAYILANGPDGLRQTTEDAVLNANYIRKGLEGTYDLPYSSPSMHEVVFSDKLQAKKGAHTMDIAKRLIDYGFHPYTTAFPLIVPGAMMIEPTESESKEEIDLFLEAMKSIAQEVEEDAEIVKTAPHSTRVSRLDETAAARKPVLRWKPSAE